MRRKDVNMLEGSIVKGIIAITLPIMLMNVLQNLFNIVDMTILKSYDTDGLSVGAVGASSTLISLITNLITGIATGANVVVAKHLGRKEPADAEKAAGTAVLLAGTAGLILAMIGIFGAEIFLDLVNCPPELESRAILYFRMYFAGVPLLMVYNFCAAILRSSGNSQQTMIISLTGGAVKVAGTYLFVGVFRMGIMGVSLATLVAWGVFSGMSIWSLTRPVRAVRLRFKYLRFYKSEIMPILRVGVPTGLQMGLYSFANVAITATVNSFGAQATTGLSIANTFDGLLYSLCHATSLAVLPYVSQNVAAGNIKRANQSIGRGVLVSSCIGAFFGALSAIFSKQLSSLMSEDPTVIAYSCQKMIIISSTYFICGINDIFGAALRGMGKPMIPPITTLIFMCAIRFLWVWFVFPLIPNLTFLYLIWPIGWILSIITHMCVFFPTAKKLTKTAAHPVQPANG